MKVLVSGTAGQLARCLIERAKDHTDIELIALGRPHFDLLDPTSLVRQLERVRPDVVVSAAAYTAVDAAETNSALAFSVNADGAGHLSAAAEQVGAAIIHISTDYVFSGDKGAPYDERDPASPLGVYGLSKYAGELAVSAANGRSLILRTAWAYSPYGHNFVRTMLHLAQTRHSISVVADRFGSPTSMLDVADAVLHAASILDAHHYGICHLVNRGHSSWAGFARHVFAVSRSVGGPWAEVADIPADLYETAAPRPKNSELAGGFFERSFKWQMPEWQESVADVTTRLARQMIMPTARRR